MEPLEYSRYARQLVAARPELREELERAKDPGWTREAMQSFLREQGAGDESALHSALRRLRQRVLFRDTPVSTRCAGRCPRSRKSPLKHRSSFSSRGSNRDRTCGVRVSSWSAWGSWAAASST